MYDCEDHWISKMSLVETSLVCFAKSWGSCYLTPADRAGSQCLLTQPYSTQSTALCLFGTRKAELRCFLCRKSTFVLFLVHLGVIREAPFFLLHK